MALLGSLELTAEFQHSEGQAIPNFYDYAGEWSDEEAEAAKRERA